jgi:hypothetical protein
MYLTRRGRVGEAAADWFELQRGWWRGTTPVTRGFPAPSDRYRRALDEDWSWQPAGTQDLAKQWASPSFDASGWKRMALGVVGAPQPSRRIALRRTFTVPAEWTMGRVTLSLRSSGYPDFAGTGRLWIDGALAQDWGMEAVDQIGEDILEPGSTHTLLIETRTEGTVTGVPGSCWLSWIPEPQHRIDLAGTWATAPDLEMRYTGQVTLPGPYSCKAMRRTVAVPESQRGRSAVVSIAATRAFSLIVNGTFIPFSGGPAKNGNVVAVTPFLHYDADNVIELISPYDRCEVRRVSLDFYDPALGYP